MTLYVKPISALLTHDTQMFSNMDPYVILKIKNDQKRSRTHKEGGKKPRWDQVFTFKVVNPSKLEVKVMDEDTLTDDVVGSTTIDLSKYVAMSGEAKQYFSLTYKNRSAGKIYLSIRYQGSSSSNFGNAYGQQSPNVIQGGSGWGPQPNYPQPTYNSWGPSQPNSNWGPYSNNSGWQQQNPPEHIMYNQPPPMPNGNVLGLLGNVLNQNVNQQPQQNSGWGANNNGWGTNNNGWGANSNNNGNSGWGSGW